MTRTEFRKAFRSAGPAVLPVIHVADVPQAMRNVRVAIAEGAHGVFLINHDFPREDLLPIIERVREAFPSVWLGVNFLGVTGVDAFPILGELQDKGIQVDAYWADDARIDEGAEAQTEAQAIDAARAASGWRGLYFGGTAFKKQREVTPSDYGLAAEMACRHMDAVTTSGTATGEAAELAKIETFRTACGDHPLAVASGVTPDNVDLYAGLVDAILVATGINHDGDFYNIDPARLRRLIKAVRDHALTGGVEPDDRDDRWYLPLMAPNTKGPKFAWLDPTSIYINGAAFHALLDDLCAPYTGREVDVVAGLDAMGFVLAAGMAARLGVGMLPIRKAGKLCVDTDAATFTNYSGRTQDMEMRKPAIAPGTRVLLVDQWVETGGTMAGAIELVERQGGTVAGIVAIAIEENAATDEYRKKYKCIAAVMPGTKWQRQCNHQDLESFKTYKPEQAFPAIGG